MPRKRRSTPELRDALTDLEWSELMFGTGNRPSWFTSALEKRRKWLIHRDEFMQFRNAAWRPDGYWEVEAPLVGPFEEGDEREDWLRRYGLLEAGEAAELDAAARRRAEMRVSVPGPED